MKKKLFLFGILIVQAILSFAQAEVETSGGKVSIDTASLDYPPALQKSSLDSTAKQDTAKQLRFWFEPGDGFFTRAHNNIHTLVGKQSYNPLLLETLIYDTTRQPPTLLRYNNSKDITRQQDPDHSFTNFLTKPGVKITANVFDIVPKDQMAFAITYRTLKIVENVIDKTDTGKIIKIKESQVITQGESEKFKLYFFYNNDSIFKTINSISDMGTVPIENIRMHNNENPIFNQTLLSNALSSISANYSNWVCFDIPNNRNAEKTVFISLIPNDTIQLGKSVSVYAVLTNSTGDIIEADSISNMRVAPAHDPNFIIQTPNCLLLPKRANKFDYTVHFQNTGGGKAKEVKLIIQMPEGLDWSSFSVKKATFAGVDFTRVINSQNRSLIIDKVKNTIEAYFYDSAILGKNYKLFGTANLLELSNNPQTMGEILFTITSTPNTSDSLIAYADIYFRSEHPSKDTINGYEPAVRTNFAISTYKECCTCLTTPHCVIIFGLCWWWWIIIIVVILIIWWWLVTKNRRKKNNYSNNNQC